MHVLKNTDPFRIDRDFDIPSIPLVLIRIIQTLGDESASARELEQLIHHDPSLSARILKIANSAYYSFRNEVRTISHAIALLGINLVTSLAIGINIFDSFTKGAKAEAALISKLWMHSFGVGVLSKEIWTRRSTMKEGEFAFLCGLLHDLGKVVLFRMYPAQYCSIFAAEKSAKDEPISWHEIEAFGADHAVVGETLAKRWGLPSELASVIRKHHDGLKVDLPLVAAVAMSDLLAKNLGVGYDGDNGDSEDLDKFMSGLNMSESEYEQLRAYAVREQRQIEDFFKPAL